MWTLKRPAGQFHRTLIVPGIMLAQVLWASSCRDGTPDVPSRAQDQDHTYTPVVVQGGVHQVVPPLAKDEIREHVVEVLNQGTEPVEITKVQGSCACRKPELLTASTILPGGTARIRLTLSGEKAMTSRSPVYPLLIQFRHVPAVIVRVEYSSKGNLLLSRSRVDFGEALQGEELVDTIILRHKTARPLRVRSARCRKGRIRAGVEHKTNGAVYITIRANPLPPSEYDDLLVIKTDSEPEPIVQVPVEWKVVPGVYAEPAIINWGTLQLGSRAKREIIVRSAHGDKLTIEGLETCEDCYEVKPLPDRFSSEGMCLVEASLDTAKLDKTGLLGHSLGILTNHGKVEVNMVVVVLP